MSMSILYVEDDLVQATLVKALLEEEGHSVYQLSNGFAALEALKNSCFDIVLTDHYMPNMTGVELLQEITLKNLEIPVVLMTASNDVSLAFSALRLGAADFISKGQDGKYLKLIAPVLSRAVEKHQLQKRAHQLSRQLEYEKHISYTAMDALSQGVAVLDDSLRIKYCNPFLKKVLKLESSQKVIGAELKWLVSACLEVGRINDRAEVRQAHLMVVALLTGTEKSLRLYVDNCIYELRSSAVGDLGHVLTLADITLQAEHLGALEKVIHLAPIAMFAVTKSGRIVLGNLKACELLKIQSPDKSVYNLNQFLPSKYRHSHDRLIEHYFQNLFDNEAPRAMRGGLDVELLDFDGDLIPVEISLSGIEMQGEQRVLASVVDISHRKEAERVMQQAHQLTQSIVEQSPFSIVATDTEGLIIAVSPALENMLWYEKEELVEKHHATLFHEQGELESRASLLSDELGIDFNPGFQVLTEKARRGVVESSEWTYVRKDRTSLPVNLTVTTLRNEEGLATGYLLVAYDITQQKRASEYIEHIAHHDGLTGLPNRALMQDRLHNAILRGKRQRDCLAVLVLDLDRFKRINDTLGHLAGDQLLKTVAARLVEAVRESDTVCRMGGDEFVVLLPDIQVVADAELVCKKILDLVSKPIVVGANKLVVTPSIGFSLFPDHGDTTEELLKHADMAMYHAKHCGRSGFKAFHPDLASGNLENLAIEQALHDAFRNEELELYYQPKLDIASGKIVGVEALLRWDDVERGFIPPAKFIPLAETNGFISTLGEWVLRRACNEIQALRAACDSDIRVAVNVSPRQFESATFVSTVASALRETGLPPNALELEITESLLMADSDAVKSKLHALDRLGVVLAIDDFGTGYSSLSYVSQYPIDVIKVDRSFMRIEQKQNIAIVSAITAIAEGLELEVVAEGVETVAQLDFVRAKGCHIVQGFLFSEAVPLAKLASSISAIEATTKGDVYGGVSSL